MNDPLDPNQRVTGTQWRSKFAYAIAGIDESFRTQVSFWVHLPAAAAVIGMAAFLQVAAWQWAILVLTIAVVIAAELLNTALEQLVVVLHPVRDPRIARSLDAAAGAVLIVAIGAVIVGLIVLGIPLWQWMT